MSALPTELSTGMVHGRFIVAVIDGNDTDQEPDAIPATGRVSFKASVGYVPVPATTEGPVTVMKGPIVGVIDSDGYLSTPHPVTGKPMYRGVKLLATDDPDMAVTDWTWTADYRFDSVNATTLTIPAHSFALPSGAVVDLTTMVKVPSSPGYGLPQAEAAVLRAEAAASRAEAIAEDSVPADGKNKALIDDPNTQTRQVLDELYGVMQPVNPDDWFGRIGKKLDIPTPDPDSVAGEAVHPSVLYFPGGWNGYRYWMGYTPYAGGNDKYEDPCIAASHDGDTWVVPDGLVNPLDDAPGGVNYNSDTNLTFHNGKLHLVWRNFDNAAVGKEETLWLSTSSDGSTWSPKVKIYESNKTVRRLVSPAFQFVNGKWHMWAVDLTPTVKTMVHLTADEMTGPWSVPEVCNVPVKPGKMPWHLNVKRVGNQYVGLLNDTLQGGTGAREGDIYLITSWDGVNFASGSESVIPRVGPHHDNLYEATLVASGGGFDVWYSARITGSPSVWSILRSRLHRRVPGVPYATAGGNVRLGVIAANGGSDGVSVTFPPGLFTNTPLITASSNNGRVSPGTAAVTKDGFTLKGFNWTSGDAVQPYVSWVATQVD